ncbi:MAG: helix-turn-helix domain-containing protein [Acetobacteraceae bacterium]|nr:helix-turn-helix domain-containing protein [Acetobacteraceae bacterium]
MKRTLRPDLSAAEAAARAGEELREARLALGVTLEEAAERLRIRRPYLEALEEGRLSDLPGAAYAVGFLRTYAQALGLDAEAMIRPFQERGAAAGRPGLAGAVGGAAAAAGRRVELVFPEPAPERSVPPGVVVLAGAALAIGAYAAWYNWSGSGERMVDAVPPLPSHLEQVVAVGEGPSALPQGPGIAVVPPSAAGAQPAPGASTAAAVPTTPGTGDGGAGAAAASPAATPTRALAATMAVPAAPSPAGLAGGPAASSSDAAAPAPAATVAPEPPPAASRILLRARAETHVMVREARSPGRAPLLNRILRPGESYAVPPQEGLELSVGRAHALEVLVDGEPAPALAGLRGRRRNIPLDADRLKAGPIAAARPGAPRQASAPGERAPEGTVTR